MRSLPHILFLASVSIALSTLLASGQTTRKSDPLESRLERAKLAFTSAIDQASKKLDGEYETVVAAYTREGKLDRALAVREQREQFLSSTTRPAVETQVFVEDGWTILFRS